MISLPLDEAYLQWLYSQVGDVENKRSSKSYWNLFRQLYTKEFIWLVPNDDNRVEDGKALRDRFIEELRLTDVDPEWMDMGCSFLEMVLGLSKRLAFDTESEPSDWFWHFMNVLKLDIYNDNIAIPHAKVNNILDTVIWRLYRKDGHGGLFPLKHPQEDQTKIEIWYQLSAYLLENS